MSDISYQLRIAEDGESLVVRCLIQRQDADATPESAGWAPTVWAVNDDFASCNQWDLNIAHLMRAVAQPQPVGLEGVALQGREGARLMDHLVDTGRMWIENADGVTLGRPLKAANSREAFIGLNPCQTGPLKPALRTIPGSIVLMGLQPIWYVDAESGSAGLVRLPFEASRAVEFRNLPEIAQEDAIQQRSALQRQFSATPPRVATVAGGVRTVSGEPMPFLTLKVVPGSLDVGEDGRQPGAPRRIAFASFDYSGFRLDAGDRLTRVRTADGERVDIERRYDLEDSWLAELWNNGLKQLPETQLADWASAPASFAPADKKDWERFLGTSVPLLKRLGWQILVSPDFPSQEDL